MVGFFVVVFVVFISFKKEKNPKRHSWIKILPQSQERVKSSLSTSQGGKKEAALPGSPCLYTKPH